MSSQDPNNNQPPEKKSKGRQKIKIEKIENQTNLQVTFSKRKSGLFKKASELCTLCGAEGALIVFSPANKAYCFGHPDLETIIERYEREQQQENNDDDAANNNDVNVDDPIEQRREAIMGAHRNSNIRELSSQLTRFESMTRSERGLEEEIESMRKIGVAQQWFPKPVQELSYSELCFTRDSVLQFKTNLNEKVQMIIKENTTIVATTPANTTFISSGINNNNNNNNNNAIHINSVVNYNNSPVSDPYRPAVPGSVDQKITRGVSFFDQFGLRINNNSPYVPQQIAPTYAAPQVQQALPSDNLLPPFVHTGGNSDLGLGNYYGGGFEYGESSNLQAVSGQATTDYAPLVGSGDAAAGLYYNNTLGLSGYDQQMTGGGFAGNVDSNYDPNVGSAAGNINLDGYGEQQGDGHMNIGGPIANLQTVSSDNQQFGLNDQLNFDPNSVGTTHQLPVDPNSVGTTQQLPFDPNSVGTQLPFDPNSVGTTLQLPFDPTSVGTTHEQLPFDPNVNDFGYGGFDGTGGFGAAPDGM